MAGRVPAACMATSAASATSVARTATNAAATTRAAAARAITTAAVSQQQSIRQQQSNTARRGLAVSNRTYNCLSHGTTNARTTLTSTFNVTSTTANPTPRQGLTRTQQQRTYASKAVNATSTTTTRTPRQGQQQRAYGSTPLVTDASTVDLRSDTVTLPCKRLRAAMAGAKVGDDVFGEDPTVARLEECVAMLLGKERGLFVPSGSMANLIAVGVHCRRGDEFILGNKSHVFMYEAASASAFMGVGYHTLSNLEDGGLDLDAIAGAIREEDQHFPRSSLLCLENTQNACGTVAISADRTAEMAAVARRSGLKVHVDGARLWNAAVALDVRPSELVTSVDTVSVCLSKGLGAPVGSVLVGSAEFIAEAHRMRKALGGGMRQAGVIAAAGLEAIVNNYTRLQEDHDNAAALASGLAALPGVRTKMRGPSHTNAVYFEVAGITGEALQGVLNTLERDHGVLMLLEVGGTTVRAMTNLGVDREGVERAVEAMGTVFAASEATQ